MLLLLVFSPATPTTYDDGINKQWLLVRRPKEETLLFRKPTTADSMCCSMFYAAMWFNLLFPHDLVALSFPPLFGHSAIHFYNHGIK